MATQTDRLGLNAWADSDTFQIGEHTANVERLDQFPGIFICTSTTRPGWGAPQTGMWIWETDTRLVWEWTGSAFERVTRKGWLNSNSRSSSISSASTTPLVAVQATITVPAGGRPVLVVVEGPGVASTVGITALSIYRDATQVQGWTQGGGPSTGATDQPKPIAFSTLDTPAAGTYAYSLRFAATAGYGGTSTLSAAPGQPLAIHCLEV